MKLSELVTEYVSFKQSIGMSYRSESVILRSFCKAISDMEISEVTPASVSSFIAGAGPITTFWHRKYEVLGGFYNFALTRGYVEASPLPRRYLNARRP